MPEVPTVATSSEYLKYLFKNKIIKRIKMYKKITGSNLFEDNKYKVFDVNSKGKISWFHLKSKTKNLYIIYHFKMSGYFSFNKSSDKKHMYEFSDGAKLYYNDTRGFSSVQITNNVKNLNLIIDELAPDLLKTEFTDNEFYDTFTELLEKKRKNMVLLKLLMNQKTKEGSIGSGIGNYLSAEILYNAKLSPKRKLSSLSKKEIKILSHSIKYIIKLSYLTKDKLGHFDLPEIKEAITNYHKDIKIKKKEKFDFQVYQQTKDANGNTVKHEKIVNSRTAWWVPNVQV
jgi:formamidopyrimidine-DNA glycosylase